MSERDISAEVWCPCGYHEACASEVVAEALKVEHGEMCVNNPEIEYHD